MPRKGNREWGGVAVLNSVVSTGLTETPTFEQRMKEVGVVVVGSPAGRYLWGEGTASAETLGGEETRWLELSEEEGGGGEVRKVMGPPCK